MKPKEKAEELFEKFRSKIISFLSDNMKDQNAKQCALIAVDEILNNFGLTCNGQTFYTEYRAVEFYQQVRQEIENL